MSGVRSLLQGMQLPLRPNVEDKDSLNKWIDDIHEYLRRLQGIFTGDNILNTIVNDADVTTFTELVKFKDFQTSAFDSDDLIVYSELTTDSDAYKLYIDISAMTGYSASEYQFLFHNDAGAASWVGIEDWADYNGSATQVLTHVSGTLTWIDVDTC